MRNVCALRLYLRRSVQAGDWYSLPNFVASLHDWCLRGVRRRSKGGAEDDGKAQNERHVARHDCVCTMTKARSIEEKARECRFHSEVLVGSQRLAEDASRHVSGVMVTHHDVVATWNRKDA